jgi:serine/threonine-protein kinase
MAKGELLKKDWFIALVFSILFIVAAVNGVGFLGAGERFAYDLGVKSANRNPGAASQIAIVAIDDESIRKLGRWPWPRTILAETIEQLTAAKAKVIGLQVLLSEPQTDPGLAYIRRIGATLGNQKGPVANLLKQAEQDLNTDSKLAAAIPAGNNVVLPMYFTDGTPLGKPDGELPEFAKNSGLSRIIIPGGNTGQARQMRAVTLPLTELGEGALALGHLNQTPGSDGAVRSDPLAVDYYGELFPSIGLVLAARSLNLGSNDITVVMGEGIKLGNLNITTTPDMRMLTSFYQRADGSPAFAVHSLSDVRDGKVAASEFASKIVLIGPTATGVGAPRVTPVRENMDEPVLTANVVASILNQDFYTQPLWTYAVQALLFLGIVLYLMLVLPKLSALAAAVGTVSGGVLLLAAGHYLLLREQVWLQTVSPALMLFMGHAVLTTKRFFMTERAKEKVEADSAHTNRMLGLAFQSQGQLDMALDKFRALPVDDSVLELVYNLALDFERKRQFSKAANAYDYILGHNPKFRDAGERRERAQKVDSTIILGGGKAAPGGTLVLENVGHKPTLGRYEVERELGKGAMGAVYFGRDPRINRTVAIKTMALSAEFEGHDLEQARSRFFREAETAGRLSHPSIVTIFDAGEEHDLAYIAMEFLEGKDLTGCIHAGHLLPAAEVADISARIAEALAYAHSQDVVHRDIKPANIMYDRDKKAVKVTDFGIARITASSRTRTGVVLGTPSYMSPEQLAGKHVDGRSDLFSLGVMTFQLLTGKLPFDGDSLTTLMYQIANEPHPDITALQPALPACMREFMDKALAKKPEARFQDGAAFAQALRECFAAGDKAGSKKGRKS